MPSKHSSIAMQQQPVACHLNSACSGVYAFYKHSSIAMQQRPVACHLNPACSGVQDMYIPPLLCNSDQLLACLLCKPCMLRHQCIWKSRITQLSWTYLLIDHDDDSSEMAVADGHADSYGNSDDIVYSPG